MDNGLKVNEPNSTHSNAKQVFRAYFNVKNAISQFLSPVKTQFHFPLTELCWAIVEARPLAPTSKDPLNDRQNFSHGSDPQKSKIERQNPVETHFETHFDKTVAIRLNGDSVWARELLAKFAGRPSSHW
jgi:hypothetical protein